MQSHSIRHGKRSVNSDQSLSEPRISPDTQDKDLGYAVPVDVADNIKRIVLSAVVARCDQSRQQQPLEPSGGSCVPNREEQ